MGSVNAVGTYGGLVIGAVIGGLPGRALGVTAPFWFAFSLDSRWWPAIARVASSVQLPDCRIGQRFRTGAIPPGS